MWESVVGWALGWVIGQWSLVHFFALLGHGSVGLSTSPRRCRALTDAGVGTGLLSHWFSSLFVESFFVFVFCFVAG